MSYMSEYHTVHVIGKTIDQQNLRQQFESVLKKKKKESINKHFFYLVMKYAYKTLA